MRCPTRAVSALSAWSVWSFMAALLAVTGLGARASAQCAETWIAGSTFGGPSQANVRALTLFDHDNSAATPAWLVVGATTGVPGFNSPGVAAWDGVQWRGLGAGFNSTVEALHVHNGELYAAGSFTGGIARWTGTAWVLVGPGLNGQVNTITSQGSDLIVGGTFSGLLSGGGGLTRVARWNGATWSALGTGLNTTVNALTIFNGQLVAGGDFTTSGGGPALRVAVWNGAAWATLGAGITSSGSTVNTLHVHNGELHIGGTFSASGANVLSNVARWTGSEWVGVGPGLNSTVNSLRTYTGNLVAGGSFSASGAQSVARVAQFVSGAWTTIGTGVGSTVVAIQPLPNNELAIAGQFTEAGPMELQGLARFNGLSFVGFGNYLSNAVLGLTEFEGDLVAVGRFRSNGERVVNRVARRINQRWEPIGIGFGRAVNAAIVFNNQLFVGGDFFAGDGVSTQNYAARWDGTTWQPTPGLNSSVVTFAIYNGELYAGGSFTGAVARWTGSAWAPFSAATRPNGNVTSLTTWNGQLIAAGSFNTVGGLPAQSIAAWNGSAWTALGTTGANTSGSINVVAVHNGDLYAAGGFTTIGGTAAARVARWNGSAWSAVGGGAGSTVNAMTSFANELVIGGGFTQVDGSTGAELIARWNGAQWRPLGSGLSVAGPASSGLNALLVLSTGELAVGSGNTIAGGLPAAYVATFTSGGGAIQITQQPPAAITVCPQQEIVLGLQTSGTGTFRYQWRKDGVPLRDGRGIGGATASTLTIQNAGPLDAGVYDVVVINDCGPLLSSPSVVTFNVACAPACGSVDFNNDGVFPDDEDLAAFIRVLGGGTCP